MSAPVTLTTAMGPWIGAMLASMLSGYAPMFLLLGAVGALATLISLASTPPHLTSDRFRPASAPAVEPNQR